VEESKGVFPITILISVQGSHDLSMTMGNQMKFDLPGEQRQRGSTAKRLIQFNIRMLSVCGRHCDPGGMTELLAHCKSLLAISGVLAGMCRW
jgi:hypothetical protein